MLPVAELHVHIEGTLEPELLVSLAARNDVALPTTDVAELRARYRFDDLQSFLDLYYANLRVLRQDQDFYDLAAAYLARAAAAGVRRAEIFFDPQTHLGHGVPLAAVFGGLTAALADGAARHGISADLILCFLRDLGADAAAATLRDAAALPGQVHRRRARLGRGRLPARAVHRGVPAGRGRRTAAGGARGGGGRPGLRARGDRPAARRARRPRVPVHGRPGPDRRICGTGGSA